MRLKLRGKKNGHGQKIWGIYQVYDSGRLRKEKLHKALGAVPKALALKIFEQSRVDVVCQTENIRHNVDISFLQVCEEYLARKCRPPLKTPGSFRQDGHVFRRVRHTMAKVFDQLHPYRTNKTIWIHEITLPILDCYKVARKEEGVSNTTINKNLNFIRGALRYAMEANYLIRFPFDRFRNLKQEEPRREWIEDVGDVEKVIENAKSPMTRIKLKLGFEAGLRKAEILHLKLEEIDLNHRLLRVYGQKENRFKEIPMSEEMAETLRPLMTYRYDRNGRSLLLREPHQKTYLFCKENGEHFVEFGDGIYRAQKKAGLTKRLGVHSMRHTFASHLLQNGANPVDVSHMLGHKKPSTTLDIYAHSSKDGRWKAFERLPYLKRPSGDVIPLRRAVNSPAIFEGGSKWGVNEEATLGWMASKYLNFNERETGVEPATSSLGSSRSTN